MKPRVLIVEDKMIIAQDIRDTLVSLGYTVTGIASSGESAINCFLEIHPEIVLMDIRLKGELNGIETAKKLQELGHVIIIYLTAHSDPSILQSAFETHPVNYLVKPFSEKDLEIAIGLAASTLEIQMSQRDYVLFRHQGIIEKINFNKIHYAKANGSYTIICTDQRNYMASFNLNKFQEVVDDRFIRTHRSFAVNLDKVERFSSRGVFIDQFEIPISRSYKNKFFERFKSQ